MYRQRDSKNKVKALFQNKFDISHILFYKVEIDSKKLNNFLVMNNWEV